MKQLIAIAVAAAFAVPAYAQTKSDSTTLPSAQERAQNREAVKDQADKAESKLPNAQERAENRDRASGFASSAALTTKVKTALASDVGMRTMTNIDVDSDNGVVTLKGKVDTAEAKKKAEEIAKKVDGVKSVKNELTVEKKS
jgi:hyperosmotically inducible periplasmic protein